MTKESSDSAFSWVFNGLKATQEKQYETAIECFKKAIDIEPEGAYGYYYLGKTYALLNEYQAAINNFERAISYKPDYAAAWIEMGLAYHNIGKQPKAIECIAKGNEFASMREKKPAK
ncbi:MAG: tetratricopeptide repeat protein [Promethearchaeota archaeon]|nr:MAG: tetratricopeptide repeat protein [Candidatus Lokiarchaeota archaeon]